MFSKLAPGFPVSDSSYEAICFIGFTKSDQLQGGDTSFQGCDIMYVPVTFSHLSLARWQIYTLPSGRLNLKSIMNLQAPQGGPSRMEPGFSAPPSASCLPPP